MALASNKHTCWNCFWTMLMLTPLTLAWIYHQKCTSSHIFVFAKEWCYILVYPALHPSIPPVSSVHWGHVCLHHMCFLAPCDILLAAPNLNHRLCVLDPVRSGSPPHNHLLSQGIRPQNFIMLFIRMKWRLGRERGKLKKKSGFLVFSINTCEKFQVA